MNPQSIRSSIQQVHVNVTGSQDMTQYHQMLKQKDEEMKKVEFQMKEALIKKDQDKLKVEAALIKKLDIRSMD